MAGVNDYVVSLILEMKARGLENAALVDASLADLVAEARKTNLELDALRDHARDSSLRLREMSGTLDDMNSRLRTNQEELKRHGEAFRTMETDIRRGAVAAENVAQILEQKLTPALNNAGAAANRAGGPNGFMGFLNAILPGGTTAAALIPIIAGLALAFAPLTAELGASLVLLGAWVVGATAFAAVIALAAGPMLILAGGIAALGIAAAGGLDPMANLEKANKSLASAINATEAAQEAVRLAQLRYDAKPTAVNLQILKDAQEQLTETQQKQVVAQRAQTVAAQQAAGPISVLHEKIVAMGQAFGQQALPFVNQSATAMINLLPRVQTLGQEIFNWFGPRFPAILKIGLEAIDNAANGFQRLGTVWGQFYDRTVARAPEFGGIINGAFNRLIDGAIGLLLNLERLSNWFVERLPTLGANANSTFSNLGWMIQGLGAALGHFVDWIISNWPGINHAFQETWKVIQDGWNQVRPMFDLFGITLQFLKPTIQDIVDHLYLFKPLLALVAAAFLIVIGVIFLVMVVLIALAATLTVAAFVLTKLVEYIISQIPVAGAQFSWLGTVVHDQMREAGDQMSALGTTMKRVLDGIDAQLQEAGAQFSALGTTAHAVAVDTGKAWDAIGTKVQEIQTKNSVAIATGNDEQSKKIRDSNKLNESLISMSWNAISSTVAFWLNEQWKEVTRQWDAITAFLSNAWNALWRFASYWWNAIFNSIAFWLNAQWQEVVRQWNAITSWLGNTWNGLYNTAGFWWGAIHNTVVGWLQTIQTTAKGIWDGIVSAAGSAMSGLWNNIHNGIKSAAGVLEGFINAVDDALYPVIKVTAIPRIDVNKLAEGGVIPGYAPGQDTVPALLSPGEAVLTPQAVRQMGGAPVINAINRNSGVAHFAAGGYIPPLDGQCVPYVENALGIYWPVRVASELARYVNSQTAKSGEAAVFTGGAAGHVALVTGPGDGFSFPVTDSNWVAPLTIGSHIMNKSMYGFAGFIDTGHGAVSGLPGVATAIVDVLGPIIDGLLNTAKGQISGVPEWIRGLPGPLLDELAGGVKNQFSNLFNAAMNPFAGVAGGAVNLAGNLGSWIAQAIAATGVPSWWGPLLGVLIGRESGGNPSAINRTDINAILGHPSQGLMQLIPSNFAAYHVPGTSGNILDPVANIAAGIRYILSRYGSILSVQQANAALPPRGYDNGGALPTGLSYVYNGTGRSETVTPAPTMDQVVDKLSELIQEVRILNGRQRMGSMTASGQFG